MLSEFSFNKEIPDEEIIEFLHNPNHTITVSFISPRTGIPHMCVVWGYFYNNKFYFQTDDHTFKAKFINKGMDKVGISVSDPTQFPEYYPGKIPYISIGGPAMIRRREEFPEFDKVIRMIIENYISDKIKSEKIIEEIKELRHQRVLIEVDPQWIKARRVPGSAN